MSSGAPSEDATGDFGDPFGGRAWRGPESATRRLALPDREPAPGLRPRRAHVRARTPQPDAAKWHSGEPVVLDSKGLNDLVEILTRAADPGSPPLDRSRLLAAFSRQIDRVVLSNSAVSRPGRHLLHNELRGLCAERDRVLEDVLPALAAAGMAIVGWDETTAADRQQLRILFDELIYPLVTPLAVDATHPFPGVANISLYVAALIRDCDTGQRRFGCVPIPQQLVGLDPFRSGFVQLDAARLLGFEAIIGALLDHLFPGVQVMERSSFRIVRAEASWAGANAAAAPTWFQIARLEIEGTTSPHLADILGRSLHVANEAVYRTRAPLALAERIVAAYEGQRLADRQQGQAAHRLKERSAGAN